MSFCEAAANDDVARAAGNAVESGRVAAAVAADGACASASSVSSVEPVGESGVKKVEAAVKVEPSSSEAAVNSVKVKVEPSSSEEGAAVPRGVSPVGPPDQLSVSASVLFSVSWLRFGCDSFQLVSKFPPTGGTC